jgi:hypothetical protein
MAKNKKRSVRRKKSVKKPFKLTFGEMKNPMRVIEEFFKVYRLSDVRNNMSYLLDSVLKDEPESILDTVEFTEDIERFTEATLYLMNKKK